MSIWTFFKLIAGVLVLGVMAFCGLLAYHMMVKPLDGVFEKIIPNPKALVRPEPEMNFAKMLDSADMPDIDPGEKAFQKAHELIAMGKLPEARDKLDSIISTFPGSPSAPIARRIIGEMNMDEILSPTYTKGKQIHAVKRGDSYFSIVSKYHTSLDAILFFNSMMELGNLQPGDELQVVPLEFRILIEPQRKALSLWEGNRFLREYPIVHLSAGTSLVTQKVKIDSKFGIVDGRKIQLPSKEYRGADKVIYLGSKPPLQIRQAEDTAAERAPGIYLLAPDMEELSMLTRPGNEVEIRMPTKR